MRQTIVRIGLLVLLGSIAACGGGGGGGGGGGSSGGGAPLQPIAYQGNTSPATITNSNAKSLLNDVLGSSTTSGSLLRSASPVGGKSIGAIALAEKLHDFLRQRSDSGRNVARAVVNETDNCMSAGSVTFTGTIDDTTGLGNVTARFNNCSEFGSTLDGEVIYRILGYNAGTVTSQVTDFTLLRFRDNSFDVSMSGSIASSLNGDTESQTHNTVTRDNVTGRMSKVENLLVSVVGSGSVLLSITGGRIYDSVEGYVELSTIGALSFSSVDADFPNSGGPLVLLGTNGARLMATPIFTGFFSGVQIDVYLDADNVVDSSLITPWDDLRAPVINQVRTLLLTTNDLVYDRSRNRLYASVPASAAAHPNSVAIINPTTGLVDAYISAGTNPTKLAISDNGQYLYVAIDSGRSVVRVDLTSMALGPPFTLGNDPNPMFGAYSVEDMEVLPGSPRSIAISRKRPVSPRHGGVVIYDDAVMRLGVTANDPISNLIEFGSSSTRLYGVDIESSDAGLRRMTVDANGVAISSLTNSLFSTFLSDMKYDGGRIYTSSGVVIDPEDTSAPIKGSFALSLLSGLVRPDAANSRVYFVEVGAGAWILEAFNTNTSVKTGSLQITGNFLHLPGDPLPAAYSFVRWGTSGLAFNTNDNKIYLLTTDLIH